MYQEVCIDGLVCIDTSSVLPVSNLYRHVLKVLAEASYKRRTIWVKAKMPGFYILLAFQYWLRKNMVPFKWTIASNFEVIVILLLIRLMLMQRRMI